MYFRGNSYASENEGWRQRGKNFQAEGSLRETLRNCREEREIYLQPELKVKLTCPVEAEGVMQSLLRDLKAGELLEWNEAWKTSISNQGEFPKLPFVSILF